jgi:putative hydrolase of the HAD superfamily
MKKAVFFDAGGTLIHVDYDRVGRAVWPTGRRALRSEWLAAEYAGRAAIEEAMMRGDAPTDSSRWGVFFRAMLSEMGIDPEGFELVAPRIVAEHQRSHLWCVSGPEIARALADLRRAGYFVAVISNADGTVERLLDQVGLTSHLSFVIDSGLVDVEKPDPRIFQMALERAGVKAEESYYVGDLYPVDVTGARAAGLEPVLLDPLGRYAGRDCRTTPDVPTFAAELVSAVAAA